MAESNYDVLRERVLWERDTEPLNRSTIIELLDALNCDIKGEEHHKVADIRRDRWWNS